MNRVEERIRERKKENIMGLMILTVPTTLYLTLHYIFPEGICTWFC